MISIIGTPFGGLNWLLLHSKKGWVQLVGSFYWVVFNIFYPGAVTKLWVASEMRGCGLKFAVPQRTAALHRIRFRQHNGTRISTISLKSDYRERLKIKRLLLNVSFLCLKCLLNEFKCM